MSHWIRNIAMTAIDAGFLGLAWCKSALRGYATPDPLKKTDVEGQFADLLNTFATLGRAFSARLVPPRHVRPRTQPGIVPRQRHMFRRRHPHGTPAMTVSAKPNPFRVEVHASLDDLASLWPRAGDAGGPACHVFQTAEFMTSWEATYGAATGAKPAFVLVREAGGAPLLLLPLAITRQFGARILSFADATACDYNAPILFRTDRRWTADSAADLWEALKRALPPFDVAVLDRMPADIDGHTNPLALLARDSHPVSCHFNDLTRPWAEVEAGFHGLRTLRKSARALARIAPTRLEIAETRDQREAILDRLLAQKQRRFEDTFVPGFETHPEKRAFFETATEAFADRDALVLTALRVGDEIVASGWAITHGGRCYWLLIGSETGAWASYSPGRVLYLLLIEWLHGRGCTALDLGIGDESWKLMQAEHTVPLRMHVEATTLLGRAYLGRQSGMERLRGSAAWQFLRPFKWVVLRNLRRAGPARRNGNGA